MYFFIHIEKHNPLYLMFKCYIKPFPDLNVIVYKDCILGCLSDGMLLTASQTCHSKLALPMHSRVKFPLGTDL